MSAPDLAETMRGRVVRLHVWPDLAPGGIVAIAADHDAATPAVMLDGPPSVHCLLTHDAEVTCPSATGRALMASVLAEGGTALLGFERVADAVAAAAWCRKMAEGGDQ